MRSRIAISYGCNTPQTNQTIKRAAQAIRLAACSVTALSSASVARSGGLVFHNTQVDVCSAYSVCVDGVILLFVYYWRDKTQAKTMRDTKQQKIKRPKI